MASGPDDVCPARIPLCELAYGHALRARVRQQELFKSAFEVIVSQTNKPLKMAITFGFVMSVVSLLLAVYNVIARLVGIITLSGYTTTVFSIWFVGGLILFVLGIIGLYIGKIYDQVKGRPYSVVRETINVD